METPLSILTKGAIIPPYNCQPSLNFEEEKNEKIEPNFEH